MKRNFFDKSLPQYCKNCKNGRASEYTEEIFCMKHGITQPNESCRHYKYDPLKRVPQKPEIAGEYSAEDFKL
ncbi:MAG: hypothetical protein MJ132_01660 [Clostridia bacterium]|nr:hypothetical protein [Clostridia bacterium]